MNPQYHNYVFVLNYNSSWFDPPRVLLLYTGCWNRSRIIRICFPLIYLYSLDSSSIAANLVANAWGNGIWVALGEDGSSVVSSDLETFTFYPASKLSFEQNQYVFMCYFQETQLFYTIGTYQGWVHFSLSLSQLSLFILDIHHIYFYVDLI